jgi:hypothetical protein
MMTSGSPRNPNKRQKAGEGFVSIASTMTNLVLLAFMLLAFAPTSSLAEFTNDALEIGDTHAILERSKVRSFRFFLKPDNFMIYYDTTTVVCSSTLLTNHGNMDDIKLGVEMITSPHPFCWASISAASPHSSSLITHHSLYFAFINVTFHYCTSSQL